MTTATIPLPETFKLETVEPVYQALQDGLARSAASFHIDGRHCSGMDYAAAQLLVVALTELRTLALPVTAELSETVVAAFDDLGAGSLLDAAVADTERTQA